MWWGTAIEAPDPSALAAFYSQLLGWNIVHEEPETAIVAAPEGSIYIVFQEAADYERPVWPPEGSRQRPMSRSPRWPMPSRRLEPVLRHIGAYT